MPELLQHQLWWTRGAKRDAFGVLRKDFGRENGRGREGVESEGGKSEGELGEGVSVIAVEGLQNGVLETAELVAMRFVRCSALVLDGRSDGGGCKGAPDRDVIGHGGGVGALQRGCHGRVDQYISRSELCARYEEGCFGLGSLTGGLEDVVPEEQLDCSVPVPGPKAGVAVSGVIAFGIHVRVAVWTGEREGVVVDRKIKMTAQHDRPGRREHFRGQAGVGRKERRGCGVKETVASRTEANGCGRVPGAAGLRSPYWILPELGGRGLVNCLK